MKAYLFNPQHGLYEGETFSDPATLKHENGLTRSQPPEYNQGQVPVFDLSKGEWLVLPVTIVRQLMKISPTAEEKP